MLVPEARLLSEPAALGEGGRLPLDFELERLFDRLERVQIFDLDLGAEAFAARGAHRHVGVATKAAFLHVAVADAEILKHRP